MNKTIVTGRLVRDPEMRTVQSDLKITTFSVAVDRYAGSKEKKVDFYDCKAFRKQAEVINDHFFKGKPILIDGHMESSKWTDKNGATRVSWELVVENFEFIGGDKKQAAPVSGPTEVVSNPFDNSDGTPFDMNDDEFNALPM